MWSTAVRIAGLRELVATVAADDIPDDDPRVAAMVDLLGAIAENHRGSAAPGSGSRIAAEFEAGETVMDYFERRLRADLARVEASARVPRVVQWAADRYFGWRRAWQMWVLARRPVPPSLDGLVAELRVKLRRRR